MSPAVTAPGFHFPGRLVFPGFAIHVHRAAARRVALDAAAIVRRSSASDGPRSLMQRCSRAVVSNPRGGAMRPRARARPPHHGQRAVLIFVCTSGRSVTLAEQRIAPRGWSRPMLSFTATSR